MRILNIILLVFFFTNCDYKLAGTIGGGYVYEFNCTEEELNKCLNDFRQDSNDLNIPKKWEKYDNWNARGYSFLKGEIFYFIPENDIDEEEMYFVTVLKSDIENDIVSRISIRSVFKKSNELLGWIDLKNLKESDKKRIEYRFQRNILNRLIKKCKCTNYKTITVWPPDVADLYLKSACLKSKVIF